MWEMDHSKTDGGTMRMHGRKREEPKMVLSFLV